MDRPGEYRLNSVDSGLSIGGSKGVSLSAEKDLETIADVSELKSMLEGMRESTLLNPELQMLVSTTISAWVVDSSVNREAGRAEAGNAPIIEGVGATAGSEGAKKSMRKIQEIVLETSALLQKVMDYLTLSGTGRKDDFHNSGLEYEGMRSTMDSALGKIKLMDKLLNKHIDGDMEKSDLKRELKSDIQYIDASLIILEKSLQLEIARIESK